MHKQDPTYYDLIEQTREIAKKPLRESIGDGYVYMLTNLHNGKLYIGATVSPFQRFRKAIDDAFNYNDQRPISRALRKYGLQSFQWEILYTTPTEYDAFEMEQIEITYYRSNGYQLYNIQGGGATHKYIPPAYGKTTWHEGTRKRLASKSRYDFAPEEED